MHITIVKEEEGFLVMVDGIPRIVNALVVSEEFSAAHWDGDLETEGVAEVEYVDPNKNPNKLDYDLDWIKQVYDAWKAKEPILVYSKDSSNKAIQQTVSDPIPDGYTDVNPPEGHDGLYKFENDAWVFNIEEARNRASLTRRQFFVGLEEMGIYDSVRAMEDDPEVPKIVKIELRESTSFDRNWPTLIQIAHSLDYTDEDLDELFGIEVPVG